MTDRTEPRPHLIDRARSAWRTFKDPNGTFLAAYTAGMHDQPRIVEGIVTRRSESPQMPAVPFYVSPFSYSPWPTDTTTPVFDYTPNCPRGFGCAGHVDDSALNSHHTHWERFGPSGVVAVLEDGAPATVSLADLPVEQPYTPEHALLVAHEIAETARFAQQYGLLAAFGTA